MNEDKSTGCYGTCIKLYNYRWKATSIATTEARFELERCLHAPCLPFRVTEARAYKANFYSTTISGVAVAVASEAGEEESTKIEPGFPASGELSLANVGRLPYQIIVFRTEVKSRNVPHGIFFTVNGQVHGRLPQDFVSRRLKFDYLSSHLLVSVDCTSMERTVQEDFFMASRDRIRQNEVYDDIVASLEEDLRDHAGLRELNAQRRKKEMEAALSSDSEATNFFQDLLKNDPTLAGLLAGGDQLVTTTGPGELVPFVGRKFPKFFRLSKEPKGGLVKSCPLNRTCRIELETDAVNDYFARADSPGKITFDPPNLCEHSHLWNGEFSTRFRVPWDATPGDLVDVTVTVSDVETESRGGPFVSKFRIKTEPEVNTAPPPSGTPRGTRKPVVNGKRSAPALALPNIKEVRKVGWESRKPAFDQFSAIQICNDGNGGFDFFINMDNTFLLTEMTRAKDEDKPLLAFWFKYGLALCTMGMLQDEKRRQEREYRADADSGSDNNRNGDDGLGPINRYCTGLARLIIPIIRSLYRGPRTSASP